jgi:hypothetical protein
MCIGLESAVKLELFGQIFEKYSNIKLHKNPPSGSRVAPSGRTDRHDEVSSCFSNFVKAPKN